MSGLFGSLSQSVRALNAQSRALETAGNNIANVNNTSYARQRVVFGDRGTVLTPQGAQSLGIEAKAIQQLRDALLDKQVLREIGLTASISAEDSAFAKAQAALGESIDRAAGAGSTSGASGGLTAAITEFFSAFQAFAASPTDLGERQALLQRANILAESLNLADSRLAQVQDDLDAAIEADVSEVNDLLASVAELNSQISRFEINAPGSAVDLRDQRQAVLEKLAGKVAIETRNSTTAPGQIEVFARDSAGAEVSLVASASTTPATVAFSGTGLLADGAAITLTGGAVKGALTARDGAIQTLRDSLDAFAGQLVTSVNQAYNPTGATGNFFVAGGTTAGTLAVEGSITASSLKASDSGAAADNTIAAAVAALANRKFSTTGTPADLIDGTFSQFYSGVVSDFGQAVSSATTRLESQENIEKLVRQQRDAVSGVSLDEEMTDLMKFQRAFQASSRVISVIDELLDTVVNRLGA